MDFEIYTKYRNV